MQIKSRNYKKVNKNRYSKKSFTLDNIIQKYNKSLKKNERKLPETEIVMKVQI